MTQGRNNRKRPHDDPKFRQRRAQVMAGITEHTRCWRCGKLASQHPQRHASGRPARWEVGHTVDGDNRAPIAAEWSTCNRAAGAALGHARAFGQYRPGTPSPPGPPDRSATPGTGPRKAENHYPGHYNLEDPTSIGAPPCVTVEGQLCATCAAFLANNPRHR